MEEGVSKYGKNFIEVLGADPVISAAADPI